jgi:hypothetical protein
LQTRCAAVAAEFSPEQQSCVAWFRRYIFLQSI